MFNEVGQKADIKSWLMGNEATIFDLTDEMRSQREDLLTHEEHFMYDFIWDDYYDGAKLLIQEEIGKRLGVSVDIISEVLEDYEELWMEYVK